MLRNGTVSMRAMFWNDVYSVNAARDMPVCSVMGSTNWFTVLTMMPVPTMSMMMHDTMMK